MKTFVGFAAVEKVEVLEKDLRERVWFDRERERVGINNVKMEKQKCKQCRFYLFSFEMHVSSPLTPALDNIVLNPMAKNSSC